MSNESTPPSMDPRNHPGLPVPRENSISCCKLQIEEPPYVDFFSEAGYEGYQVTRLASNCEPSTRDGENKFNRLSHIGEIYGGRSSEEPIWPSPRPESHGNAGSLEVPLAIYGGGFSDVECPESPPMRQQLPLATDQDQQFYFGKVPTDPQPSVLCPVQETNDQNAGPSVSEGKIPVPPPSACQSSSVASGSNYKQVPHENPTVSHKRERKRRCIRPEDEIKKDPKPHEPPKRIHALHYLAIQYPDSSDSEGERNLFTVHSHPHSDGGK